MADRRFILDPKTGRYIDTRTGTFADAYSRGQSGGMAFPNSNAGMSPYMPPATPSDTSSGITSFFNDPKNQLTLAGSPSNGTSLGLGSSGQTASNTINQIATNQPSGGSNWMNYAGLGAMAAAPVASVLLGRQAPRPEFAFGSSLGSKPVYEAQSVYRPQQPRIPAFLARLLMGMK